MEHHGDYYRKSQELPGTFRILDSKEKMKTKL